MTWTPRPTIKVSEVLEQFPRLGVPHFQRGRVWGTGAIASLLESLFYDTPCGSFVLWESADNAAYGVPLDESKDGPLDFLIVDGQQRIRSLFYAFTDAPLDTDFDSDEGAAAGDQKGPKQWCVNLTKAPKFDRLLKPRVRNFPLFVYTANPTVATPQSPLRDNVLPLSEILQKPSWEALAAYHGRLTFNDGTSDNEGLRRAAKLYPELRRRMLEIKGREFFVATRHKTHGLAQMADLYNRINASGKQVETEERAFAGLVGLQPENTAVSDGLRRIFQKVHPERRLTSHDALLRREEERAFGFKLFIRVFLQVCQHHLGHRQRKSSFSFDLIAQENFRRAFGELAAGDVTWLWDEAARILGHVKNKLLAGELKCDDLRALPDATGLMPVIQLLIQYRELEEDAYQPLLASLCLRFALGDISSRELLGWVAEASDPSRHAFDVVPRLLKAATSEALKALPSGLEGANSIQDRYVLLLYWLERHLGARDFKYDAVTNPKKKLKPPERLLNKAARPEKQHLVPFTYAPKIFAQDVRRTESHPFNNVGNLTYISAHLNGLDALSDQFTELIVERESARENLGAHLLLADGHEEALRHYEWIKAQLQPIVAQTGAFIQPSQEPRTLELEPRFSLLTRARRRLIQTAFETWLADLDSRASTALQVGSLDDLSKHKKDLPRIEPLLPKFLTATHPVHFLQGLGLPNEAKDRLVVAFREARRKVLSADASMLLLHLTKRKHVWLQVSGDGVILHVKSRLEGPLRVGIFSAIGLPDSGQSDLRLEPVPDLLGLVEYCAAKDADIAVAVRKSKKRKQHSSQGPAPGLDELGFGRTVIERLGALGGDGNERPRREAALSLRFRQTMGDGRSSQVVRIDLYAGGKRLGLRFRPDLGEKLKARFPNLIVRVTRHKGGCTLSDEQTMVAVLDWLAGELQAFPGHG